MTPQRFVGFVLDGFRFALPLTNVERVVAAVAITPLPEAPEVILGAIDVGGRIVPVADIRKRFGLPNRQIAIDDHFVIAHTARRPLALVVDAVQGLMECSERDIVAMGAMVPGLEYVEGIARTEDGLVLIHDLDRFLALDEERSLERAIADA